MLSGFPDPGTSSIFLANSGSEAKLTDLLDTPRLDDEGREPIYIQAQSLRLGRLPQKLALL